MSDKGATPIPSTRVILWIHARSRSTVFELAIASEKSIHVIHEPFATAYFMGEERLCHERFIKGPPFPGHRYRDVQSELERTYPDKIAVFVKDGAKVLGGRNHYGYIPKEYVNTFIVRNPKAAVLSAFRSTKAMFPTEDDLDTLVDPCIDICDMVPIYQLYKYVTEELQQRPIVVHSEDLVNSPRETLEKYCKATGLPFRESFLNWEPGNIEHFPEYVKSPDFDLFNEKAIGSSCFIPSSDSDVDLTELPEKLRQCIDEYTLLYEEMISKKL
ncbi:uncharacterized protein [Ptychodera flava]|uniref:uncharacterized protein n=1 Tax=Ptychodera flava TaxID=63121 RepID=UPI00396A79D2